MKKIKRVPRRESWLLGCNIRLDEYRTSVRLEPEMWKALRDVASRENCQLKDVYAHIASQKQSGASFTSAIRVFLMSYYRAAATEDGHERAGHGALIRNVGAKRRQAA